MVRTHLTYCGSLKKHLVHNEFNVDFEYTVTHFMLPCLLMFTIITFMFYFLHPYTTDDKCFEFKRKWMIRVFVSY